MFGSTVVVIDEKRNLYYFDAEKQSSGQLSSKSTFSE